MSPPAANWLVAHVPHYGPVLIVFAAIAWGYRKALTAPPSGTPDRDRWRADQDERRRTWRARPVLPAVARRALYALGPILAAVATGAVIYAIDLGGNRPGDSLAWVHAGIATLAVLLIAYKLAELGSRRLRSRVKGEAILDSWGSYAAAALIPPLLLTGVLLLVEPSSSSFIAYAHLITAFWWTLLIGVHLRRYLGRAIAAVRIRRSRVPASREIGAG